MTGVRIFDGTMRRLSQGSTRPPGNTNLLGINLCFEDRFPMRTLGVLVCRLTIMSVAASTGRI